MRTISFITIVIILSLLSFIFVYQYTYNYVHGFRPSNAPATDQIINETITTTSKQQQQQTSNDKGSSAIDNKTTASANGKVIDNGGGFLVYENSTYGIKIEYPSNWELFTIPQEYTRFSGGTHIVGFGLPFQIETFDIEVIHLGESFKDYLAREIDFHKNVSYTKNLETTEVNVSGYPASQIVYTTSDTIPNGKTMSLLVKVDNKVYYLTYYSNIERYSQYLPLVQKMINSLQIK